jgi:hypothetical protein
MGQCQGLQQAYEDICCVRSRRTANGLKHAGLPRL